MKVLIVSDTHRRLDTFKMAVKAEAPFDLLLHMGDVEGQEAEIREIAGCPAQIVAGNNDFFCNLDREKDIWVGPYRTLMTHGHHYSVSLGPELLASEAQARGFRLALFGHTHRPEIRRIGDVIVANPGSLSYPRQANGQASYIVMEIGVTGELHMEIKYL